MFRKLIPITLLVTVSAGVMYTYLKSSVRSYNEQINQLKTTQTFINTTDSLLEIVDLEFAHKRAVKDSIHNVLEVEKQHVSELGYNLYLHKLNKENLKNQLDSLNCLIADTVSYLDSTYKEYFFTLNEAHNQEKTHYKLEIEGLRDEIENLKLVIDFLKENQPQDTLEVTKKPLIDMENFLKNFK